MKPIIGITVDCVADPANVKTRGKLTLHWNYAEAIANAGGVPIMIPPTADSEEILSILDGWLIPGGDDIDAREWGEENHPKSKLQNPARYAFESEVFRRADPEMPVLGICYGCQFLNVVRGGSLDQHLPDALGDDRHAGGTLDVSSIDPKSRLFEAVGAECVEGPSFHHQGVGRLGDGITATARHEDGTVEAVEATDRAWTVGVQWHPERHDDSHSKKLFEAFVQRAAAFRLKRIQREAGR